MTEPIRGISPGKWIGVRMRRPRRGYSFAFLVVDESGQSDYLAEMTYHTTCDQADANMKAVESVPALIRAVRDLIDALQGRSDLDHATLDMISRYRSLVDMIMPRKDSI